MKNKGTILAILLIATQLILAQTADNRFSIGLNLVKNEYDGDYGSNIWNFQQKYYGGGITLAYYLNPSIDIGLQNTFGSYGYYESTENQFVGAKMDAVFFAHYKLNNGYILKSTNNFSPFVSLGIGLASYSLSNNASPWPTIITGYADLTVPIGVGFRYRITNSLAIQYQYLYNITSGDIHDQNRGTDFFGSAARPKFKTGNDAYGQHVFGLVLSLGTGEHAKKTPKNNDNPPTSQDTIIKTKKVVQASDSIDISNQSNKTKNSTMPPFSKKRYSEEKDETDKISELILQGVLFQPGSDIIEKGYFVSLDKLTSFLTDNLQSKLDILGHSDSFGDGNFNILLSQKRANAVKNYLVSKGVSVSQLNVKGCGVVEPIADNNTLVGRAKNRRVEFKIYFNMSASH